MPSKPAAAVLAKLGRVRKSGDGWSARCPVEVNHSHGDKNPSLSVSEGAEGRVLLTCHKGCQVEEITGALGIDVSALFGEQQPSGKVVVGEYRYVDENGELLYVKERLYPKEFRYRRPDGKGGWEWKLGRVARPLYRLPKVLEAKAAGTRVYYVEGERDVHTLESRGLVATTAGGVKDFRPQHAQALADTDLVVIADNDEQGRKLAQEVAAATGAPILVSQTAKDITEHLGAGGSLEELVPLSEPAHLTVLEGGRSDLELVSGVRDRYTVLGEAKVPGIDALVCFEAIRPRRERTGVHAEVRILVNGAVLAYSAINVSRHEDRTKLANLAAENLGDKQQGKPIRLRLDHFCANLWGWWRQGDEPELLQGQDAPAAQVIIPPFLTDSGTILYGPGGSGKSWLALIWALTAHYGLESPWPATQQRNVLYVDFEDSRKVFASRLHKAARVLGCPDRLPYYGVTGRGFTDVWEHLENAVKRMDVGLVFVDSLSRLGLGKLIDDSTANQGVDMLNGLGIPWLALGHTPHDGGHVFGSAHWTFGARCTIEVKSATSHDDDGLMAMNLRVDKANHMRRGHSEVWALGFDASGLVSHRRAKTSEFPDLAAGASPFEKVKMYLAEGAASVKDICENTELSRSTVFPLLRGQAFRRVSGGRGQGEAHYGLATLDPTGDV